MIRTASYSGVRVFELNTAGVNVMRRERDSYINATQILRAAGLPKPARTKVLEKEIVQGVHEKIQGGYAGFQGTWIPLETARQLADEYGLLDDLAPLFDYDVASGTAVERERSRASASTAAKKRVSARPQFTSSYSESSDGEVQERKKRRRGPPTDSTSNLANPNFSSTYSASLPTRKPRGRRRKDDDDMEEEEAQFVAAVEAARKKAQQLELKSSPSAGDLKMSRSYSNLSVASGMSTLPGTIRVCEVCGTTETPQWRRGPSGKRTLCNACGVKWSQGRLSSLKAFVPLSPGSSPPPQYASHPLYSLGYDSEMFESEPGSPYDDYEMEVGSVGWKLRLEVRQLKAKLKEMERTQRKLKQLLFQAKYEDRELDRGYRRVVSSVKRARLAGDLSVTSSPLAGLAADPMDSGAVDDDDEDDRLSYVSRYNPPLQMLLDAHHSSSTDDSMDEDLGPEPSFSKKSHKYPASILFRDEDVNASGESGDEATTGTSLKASFGFLTPVLSASDQEVKPYRGRGRKSKKTLAAEAAVHEKLNDLHAAATFVSDTDVDVGMRRSVSMSQLKEYGEESERERLLHRASIGQFLKAVKRNQERSGDLTEDQSVKKEDTTQVSIAEESESVKMDQAADNTPTQLASTLTADTPVA